MGRSPCCDKVGLKKGPWTPEEDQKLLAYIEEHGHGSWRALPAKAGLQRCGKSCRLRWTNYLRPDIKRGKFSMQEEQTIIQLHALLGNRWSAIATHLPKRTDNEIKNYWNTHLKKRLDKMGIDPVTHKPKNDALVSPIDGPSKNASNLSHMAQWESARLEAEARLVRESKLRTSHNSSSSSKPGDTPPMMTMMMPSSSSSRSLDHAWNNNVNASVATRINNSHDLIESPTSTLSENNAPQNLSSVIEFVGSLDRGMVKEEEEWNKGYHHHHNESSTHLGEYKDALENSMPFTSSLHELTMTMATTWGSTNESLRTTTSNAHAHDHVVGEGFTNLLLNSNSGDRSLSPEEGGDSNINCPGGGNIGGGGGSGGNDLYEDNKNYWNNILNLMNYSSPSDSPMF